LSSRHLTRWKCDRGSALIEFSLVAFMFIILLLGVVEMSRLVLVYTTVANAAHAGMRYAIVHGRYQTVTPSGPGSVTLVQTVVKNYASAGLLNTANLTVNVAYPDGDNHEGHRVTVTTSYTYDPLIGYFTPLLSTTVGSTSQGVITF
jgi:Flp pilus assembly protein TadG